LSSLAFVTHVAAGDSGDHSRITDLTLVSVGGTTHLFSTTRYDGTVQHWDLLDGIGLSLGSDADFAGSDLAGSAPGLVTLSFAGTTFLVTGGGAGGALQTLAVNAGGLGSGVTLGAISTGYEGFQHGTVVTLDKAKWRWGPWPGVRELHRLALARRVF